MLKIKENQTIVFEGDSITKMIGKPTYSTWPYLRMMKWNVSWADKVEEMLFAWYPEMNIKTCNTAIGGSNIKNMLERQEDAVVPFKPDWMFISIGSNDPAQGVSIEEFESSVRAYMDRINKENKCKFVFLIGARNASVTDDENDKHFADEYYNMLKKIADETDNLYIDIGAVLNEKQKIFSDMWEGHTVHADIVHLNELGAMVVAKEALKVLGIIEK